MQKRLIEHNRHTQSLHCQGCLAGHEIPKSAQSDPMQYAAFLEAIEQKHMSQGCKEAAEVMERTRFTTEDRVRVWNRLAPTWSEMVKAAEMVQ